MAQPYLACLLFALNYRIKRIITMDHEIQGFQIMHVATMIEIGFIMVVIEQFITTEKVMMIEGLH